MTIRTGIDIVHIFKFAENIKSDAFIRKVFTPAEIAICKVSTDPVQCYAGKFATKEAFIKAIGKGVRQEVWFTQMEVLEGQKGKPFIKVNGRAEQRVSDLRVRQTQVSISYTKEIIIATVILEAEKNQTEPA